MSIIASIEDAMLELIKAQSFGYRLKTVASYAGELSGDADAIARVLMSFPAAWVSFKDEGDPITYDTQRKRWLVPAKFAIYVGTRNVRGERFGRVGSAGEVGAYQIAEDMRQLFLGRDLGLAIDHFNPGGVKMLFNATIKGNYLAVCSIMLKTKYYLAATPEAEVDWLRTGFNYYLKPGDDIADATDLLTMRTP
jgi:phage gp37-like protein